MKTSIKLPLAFGLLIGATLLSGCASNCGPCRGNGLFGGQVFQNQPVRSTIRSWFQGDNCDTCNAPAGQTVYSPNVAPLCETCNGGVGQPIGTAVTPLYGTPVDAQLQAPQNGQLGPDPSGNGLSNGANPPGM